MGSNRNFQYSLRGLFIALSVGIVFGSMCLLMGVGGIFATLALTGAFLCLWEWLASYGMTRSCTARPLATLFVSTALMAHIALMLVFVPKAAEIAAQKCGDRYGYEFDPSLPIEWEEWTTSTQLEGMMACLVIYGYPAMCFVFLGSAFIEGAWDIRGLTPAVIGSYLILLPLCVGYLQILKY